MARGGGRTHARSGRGHGRGRGRVRGGTRAVRGGAAFSHRNGFRSSRVQETEEIDKGEEVQSEVTSVSDHEGVEEQHSDSNEEGPDSRQAYSALLQALKADSGHNEPARKRRKIEPDSFNSHSIEQRPSEEDSALDESELVVTAEADALLEEDLDADNDEGHRDELDDTDLDDESKTTHDAFDQHFVSIEEQALKDTVAARSSKQIQSTVIADGLKKQTSTYGAATSSLDSVKTLKHLHVKTRLQNIAGDIFKSLSKEHRDLIGEIFNYKDVHYGNRTLENASNLRDMVCLHALNHVFKTRDRVIKNNAKLSQSEEDTNLDFRDQGFTRPKVLVIVPTKQACVRYAESITKISQPDQQENKSRFWDTFSQEDDDALDNKTDDFRELFGGNHDEEFRMGLKFTRKTIKYFSGFYNSDIIFGSALGLMRTITTGGGGKEKKKVHDADFLSSIEIVIVDHAAAIQMQNFQHLEYVFSQLNQLPKDSHGCDFGRVRNWYLNGQAQYLRQTIMFTAYHTPELNSLFSKHTSNFAGLAKYTPTYAGSMLTLLPPHLAGHTIPQTFLRIDAATPQADSDARFKYFNTTILPALLRHRTKGVLVFIPTYSDFVRLRNHLATSHEATSLSFGSVSEYTSVRDTARARSYFVNARHQLLIYSERAHHHFRYRIRGVSKIVFYGVPENPVFWTEVVGLLGLGRESGDAGAGAGVEKGARGVVRALFSRWDALKLERVVGTERVGRLINDRGGDTFEFV